MQVGKSAKSSEVVMIKEKTEDGMAVRVISGFVAGFFSTLVFHQSALALLWQAGVAPIGPFSMAATEPFGVPAMFSLAFWGGVWGVIFALLDDKFRQIGKYWLMAFLFGAIVPSTVAFLVVRPLKGQSMGGASLMLTALLINGAWGIGTAVVLRLLSRRGSKLG
jgi:hypothetical protein